jgi:hypothetical protein
MVPFSDAGVSATAAKCDWRTSLASCDRDVCTVVDEAQKVVCKIAFYYFVIDTANVHRLSASSGGSQKGFGKGGWIEAARMDGGVLFAANCAGFKLEP